MFVRVCTPYRTCITHMLVSLVGALPYWSCLLSVLSLDVLCVVKSTSCLYMYVYVPLEFNVYIVL